MDINEAQLIVDYAAEGRGKITVAKLDGEDSVTLTPEGGDTFSIVTLGKGSEQALFWTKLERAVDAIFSDVANAD